jgi:peptide/nickel transport system substrate-binding protein
MRQLSKPLAVLLVLMLAVNLFAAVPVSAGQVKVAVNNQFLTFDIQPFIEKGRVLVPVRPLCEALGASVEWDAKTRTVTIRKGDTVARITVGSKIVSITEKGVTEVVLEVPAKIVSGRTVVPLRFIAEAFGAKVDWDAAARTAIIEAGHPEKVASKPLVLGTTLDLEPINKFSFTWGQNIFPSGLTHVGLTTVDSNNEIKPLLAEKWEVAPDGKSITFHLVKNAKWHDGKPVTAKDVEFTYNYYAKHKKSYYGHHFERAEAKDDYTVTIYFKQPVFRTHLLDNALYGGILPRHIWESVEVPNKYLDEKGMIGCGPFIFEKYDPAAQTAYFRANPNYFAGKVAVKELQIRQFKTTDSMVLALKRGEIDGVFGYYRPVPSSYAAALSGDKNIELGLIPDAGIRYLLAFNHRDEYYPMKEQKFREAVSYAINYQQLIDVAAAGYGQIPTKGYIPPSIPEHNPNFPKLEYNPEKAKALLEELGFRDRDGDGIREFPDGKKLRFPVTPQDYVDKIYTRLAEVICQQLKAVGIDAFLDTEVIGNLEKNRSRWFRDRDYWLFVGTCTPFGVQTHGGIGLLVDAEGATGTCSDPEFVRIYQKINFAKSAEEYKNGLEEAQRYMNEKFPAFALIWAEIMYPHRIDKYRGWKFNSYGLAHESWLSLRPAS